MEAWCILSSSSARDSEFTFGILLQVANRFVLVRIDHELLLTSLLISRRMLVAVSFGIAVMIIWRLCAVHFRNKSCPLYTQERTCAVQRAMSALGQ